MELQTYLSIISKRRKLIIILFFVIFLLIAVVTLLIPPKYKSVARLRVLTPIGGGTNYLNFDIYYATRLMNTYASIATSTAVTEEIKKKFGLTDEPDITATVISDSELIRLTVLDPNPQRSADIANSIAEILLTNKNSSASQAQTASDSVISSQIDAVSQKLAETRAKYSAIYIPYSKNNAKIDILNMQIQNDQALEISLRDRIEEGRQNEIGSDILAVQEAQLAELEKQLNQRLATIEQMHSTAAEDSFQINNLQREISLLETQYSNIVTQMDQMRSLQAMQFGSESLILVDKAIPDYSPDVPNYPLVFALGFCLSLFLAVMFAFTLENLDDIYNSPQQISALNRTPFWGETSPQGVVPVGQGAGAGPRTPEAVRAPELKVDNFPYHQSLQTIIMSGVDKETAASDAWVKLAVEFSQKGRNTILIDCNLANPSIHSRFRSISNEKGLGELLNGKIALDSAIKSTGWKNLSILTAGISEGWTERGINRSEMGRIIEELQARFSMIVIGIPSVAALHGNSSFIYRTDGVVLVIEYGSSRKKNIRSSIELINNLNIPLLGYIVSHEGKIGLATNLTERGIQGKTL